MPTASTVVSPERFAQGMTFPEFLAQAAINRDRFEHYYETSPLTDDDLQFFRTAAALSGGPRKILALAEAWCGDVYRELPTVARIAEAIGMELRIFLRDENPDIMDEFLSNDGKSRAIPVFVFYTADLQYITRFTERPASAQVEIDRILDNIKSRLQLPKAATFTNLPEASRKEVIAAIIPLFPQWQKDSIREIRVLLAGALSLSGEQPSTSVPRVYTIRGCDACRKLLNKWDAEGTQYQERRIELSQATLDEARRYGDMVPIVVWPDGRVEQGFEGGFGCFI